MTQVPQGWALWWSRGIAYVRWRQDGKRHTVSTGEKDPHKAVEKAAKIYADSVSGKWRPTPRVGAGPRPLLELVEEWLEDFSAGRPGATAASYKLHWATHLAPFFDNDLGKITTASISDYQRARLRLVSRSTVVKEVNTLRGLLKWLASRGVIEDPAVPPLPRGHLGTVAQARGRVELSVEQVARLLTCLPDVTPVRKLGSELWCQPYFVMLYETGLRPATIQSLSVPEHWRRGRGYIEIDARHDKGRYGRRVPLSDVARATLERVAPTNGVVFGAHDFRETLETVCREAGLPRIKPYDLRHARATHLLEASGDLPGVAYLLGHKRVTTTSIYARPNERAGRAVLASAASVLSGGFREPVDP